ncbi:LuxR C-terminal-related transcriptional regulator [Chitinophaga sp. GCM10012297]|uniref:PAS domain-containing protein n=1 Tax=Chitinophaga chungangae TaxID=2821488 RepID=A0ABS3YFY7_9BACT|nr:LuxR C-terminal-related transcriptional regulator [Chitinophaga chungangae]MBO9153590.1 PAS domain-containing protein [Chitinophaga chungangae]
MKPQIRKLYQVWEHEMKSVEKTDIPVRFDEIVSSVFTAGPSYFYVIDFFDMTLSHMSASVKEIHGLEPRSLTFRDILDLIHPDDAGFVEKAEAAIISKFEEIGWDKLMKYKGSYCLRMKGADGGYRLFLHQHLVLTRDMNGGYAKCLNIHTDISHLVSVNNYKLSLIGLDDEPSYCDMHVLNDQPGSLRFTRREMEVLRLIAEGLTTVQISQKLNLAMDTVKNHRRNILSKAGVKNTAELIRSCVLNGLI